MNRFSEQLLEAFEVAMDEKISKLQYDKTIQAIITEIADANTGEYKVKYQEGIISAFASDPKEQFKIGDNIYVTVPQGDFSNKKFISHKLTNNTLTTGQYSDLSETIIEVSPDLSQLGFTYNQPQNAEYYGLIAGNRAPDEIVINSGSQLSNQFKAYINKYEFLQIKAEFMTTFDKDHIKGDYGIALNFKTIPTDNNPNGQIIPYFLNIADFMGDPYHLWTWTPQSIVIKLSKENIYSLAGISFYEKDFDDSLGEQQSTPNIFMRDLSIAFVEKVDLTQIPYYLNIFPKDGILFTNNNSLRLEGKITHYGEEVSAKSCVYKWFRRDLQITAGDKGYFKQAGWGWKEIVEEDNQESGFNTKELTIPANVVQGSLSYKLVAIQDSEIVMTKEITVYKNMDSVSIEQVTLNGTIKLKLNSNAYNGLWYYLTSNGTQEQISNNKTQEIDVTSYLFYSPATFYCQVYQNDNYLSEVSYVLRNLESSEDVSVVFVGESFFCYDANGDIGIEYSQIEQILTPEIVFNSGVISSSVEIEWLDFNGNIISDSGVEYSPIGSMIQSVRVDRNTNSLQYKIKSKFEEVSSKKNNTFKLRITTLNGQVYTFNKEIVFIKTGDPGTNGTNYYSLITIDSNSQYQFVAHNGNTNAPQYDVTLQCQVFKNGQLLQNSQYHVDWECYSLTKVDSSNNNITVKAANKNPPMVLLGDSYYISTEPAADATISTIRGAKKCVAIEDIKEVKSVSDKPFYKFQFNNSKDTTVYYAAKSDIIYDPRRYVKATIHVTDEQNTILYNFFAVSSCNVPSSQTAARNVINNLDLSYLPKYIQYATNGRDPICKRNVPTISYVSGAQEKTIVITSKDKTILDIDGSYFRPAYEFNPQHNIGLLTLTNLPGNYTLYYPIASYMNIFGNEAINGWDGVSLDLGDESDSHVFAPQIGAGNKSNDNKFTGVVMGRDSAQDKIGLYGYQNGINTFGLTEEGKAYFGASGNGRINIDGTTATIEGGGGGSQSNGMTITLATTDPENDAIRIGNNNFVVSYSGKLTATGADITGKLTAGSDSIIGGWQLTDTRLYSGTDNKYVALDSGSEDTEYVIWAGNTSPQHANVYFRLSRDGHLWSRDAEISGKVIAKTGNIGWVNASNPGWIIDNYKIYSSDKSNKYVGLNTQNKYAIFAGTEDLTKLQNSPFYVTYDGALVATNATISGNITALSGKIGGWTATTNLLSNGAVYLAGTDNLWYETNRGSNLTCYLKRNSDYYEKNNLTELKGTSGVQGQEVIITGFNAAYNSYEFNFINNSTKYYASVDRFISNEKTLKVGTSYYNSTSFTTENLKGTTSKDEVIEQLGSSSVSNWIRIRFVNINDDTQYWVKYNDRPITTKASSYYRIWAGNSNPASAKFYVTNTGILSAKGAIINGTITAENGQIGGWKINSNDLTSFKETERVYQLICGSKYGSNSNVTQNIDTIKVNTQVYAVNGRSFKFDASSTETWYTDNTNNIKVIDEPGVSLASKGKYAFWAGNAVASSAPFSINSVGGLKADSATISGNITANSGKIGGWIIDNGKLYSGSGDQRVFLYSGTEESYKTGDSYYRIWAGNSSPSNAKFSITSSGVLKAIGAVVQGDITANTGSIGSWTITSNAISTLTNESTATTSNTTGMAKSGFTGYIQRGSLTYNGSDSADKISGIAFWSGMKYVKEVEEGENKYYLQGSSTGSFFAVTHSGQLYCRNAKIQNATVEGSITVGNGARIGDWYIRDGILQNSSTGNATAYIGPTRVQLPGLTLSTTGASFTGSINASGGNIGAWYISNNGQLQSEDGTYYFGPTSANLPGLTISNNTANFSGNIASGATISGSTISGSTISGSTISGGSISIGFNPNTQKYNCVIDSNGSISIGPNTNNLYNFTVTSDGTMTANGTLSLTGASGNQNIISISGTYQNLSCTGSLGLVAGSNLQNFTYNTELESTAGIIINSVGGTTIKAQGGFYVDAGNTQNIVSIPSNGTTINLGVTASGLYILDNNVSKTLADYVSEHGGGGNATAVFG